MAKRKKPEDMTVEELRAEAAKQNVEGRSGMNRDELVSALSGGGEEGGDGEGMKPAPYPPSPSDSAGEKTDNVPQAKKIPTPAPESENPEPKAVVPTAQQALAMADAETARLKARVAELERLGNEKGFLLEGDPANKKARGAKGKTRRATVTPQGGSPMEVEIPADTPEEQRDAAAVEAWKARAGIWSAPTQPTVEHGD